MKVINERHARFKKMYRVISIFFRSSRIKQYQWSLAVLEGGPSVTLECIADDEQLPNITLTKAYANDSDSGVKANGKQPRSQGLSLSWGWGGKRP